MNNYRFIKNFVTNFLCWDPQNAPEDTLLSV